MSIFDNILSSNSPRRSDGQRYEFAAKCPDCGSLETEAYRGANTSTFDMSCDECGYQWTVTVPGV